VCRGEYCCSRPDERLGKALMIVWIGLRRPEDRQRVDKGKKGGGEVDAKVRGGSLEDAP
jgi:hypothetical protein